MFIKYYFDYLYYSFLGFPFMVRIVVLYLYIFVPFILYFVYSLVRLFLKRNRGAHFKSKYHEPVREILLSQNAYSKEEVESMLACKVDKFSASSKSHLTNVILKVKSQDKEALNYTNYRSLIDLFQLCLFWEKKLRSRSIATKHRALRKLTNFEVEASASIINALAYNRNQFLRKKARCSCLTFSETDPYRYFSESFDTTFNNWDKVEIHHALSKKSVNELPNFIRWIEHSDNSKFKCFLIEEIKLFKQEESAPYLSQLIDSPDMQVRRTSIDALGYLKYHDVEASLIKGYSRQPQAIQRQIVKTIHQLGTSKALPFLRKAYTKASDTESKIGILHAIANYNEEGNNLFQLMRNDATPCAQFLFDHVEHELITHY